MLPITVIDQNQKKERKDEAGKTSGLSEKVVSLLWLFSKAASKKKLFSLKIRLEEPQTTF